MSNESDSLGGLIGPISKEYAIYSALIQDRQFATLKVDSCPDVVDPVMKMKEKENGNKG